jgi:dihydroxy-acid dehydratase
MVWEDLRPSRIMTRKALENAVAACMALGGSTNAVVHLVAIAGRLGIDLRLEDFDRIARRTPYLANVKPSGQYLMEDFFYAGGLPALLKQIAPLLHGDCVTANGRTLAENLEDVECYNQEVIRPVDRALNAEGGLAVLQGNLCPHGAVIKPTAASPDLLTHKGKAYVFENHEHMEAQVDMDYLPLDRNTILVMKSCGPKGAPGFPEWGWIPMPRMLLRQGITDMVRISDARMSGTSFGTVVLHVSPESAVGGPLAIVETGDEVVLDVPNRRLDLQVPTEEIARRLEKFKPCKPHFERGYGKLFLDHVTQAHEGCDFDFLMNRSGPQSNE